MPHFFTFSPSSQKERDQSPHSPSTLGTFSKFFTRKKNRTTLRSLSFSDIVVSPVECRPPVPTPSSLPNDYLTYQPYHPSIPRTTSASFSTARRSEGPTSASRLRLSLVQATSKFFDKRKNHHEAQGARIGLPYDDGDILEISHADAIDMVLRDPNMLRQARKRPPGRPARMVHMGTIPAPRRLAYPFIVPYPPRYPYFDLYPAIPGSLDHHLPPDLALGSTYPHLSIYHHVYPHLEIYPGHVHAADGLSARDESEASVARVPESKPTVQLSTAMSFDLSLCKSFKHLVGHIVASESTDI